MKKRLAYLASTIVLFVLFSFSVLPQQTVAAAQNPLSPTNPFVPNTGAKGVSVKKECPPSLPGYPESGSGTSFFTCQVKWAQGSGNQVPDPTNKAMSFCQQIYAGEYFEDCNKGFEGKNCGNNAICKNGAEAKQQNKNSVDPNAGAADSEDGPPTCESGGINLSWIMCPLINGLAEAVDGIYETVIQPLLQTDPVNVSNPEGDKTNTYEIWSNFRTYGNIILIIALLVIVFGEAIGGGLIDAYAVKKTLPRLLVAVILINLSIYIVAVAVDISNIVGNGIESLIQLPFRGADEFKLEISGEAAGLGITALAGTAAVGGIWAAVALGPFLQFFLLFVLVPAFLALVAIMMTILIRTGLIIFLVIVSPIAFALYALPNTEKYFKQWWDLLFRTLLVYPIIATIFALASVLSITMNAASSGFTGPLSELMSFVALIMPLFLIPFSFRMAGGIMAQVSGAIQDRKGKINAPLKAYRSRKLKEHGAKLTEDAKKGNLFRGADPDSRRGKFNKFAKKAALTPSAMEGSPRNWRQNLRTRETTDLTSGIDERIKNSAATQQLLVNDSLNNAAMHGDGSEHAWSEYLQSEAGGNQSGEQLQRSMGIIRQSKRDMGDHFGVAATIGNFGTGTGFEEDGEAAAAISKAAGGNKTLEQYMIAKGRQEAKGAGRYDLADASFGGWIKAVDTIDQARTTGDIAGAKLEAQRILTDKGNLVSGPQSFLQGKGKSTEKKIQSLQRDIHKKASEYDAAKRTGDTDKIKAAREAYIRTMAYVSDIHSTSGGASPEAKEMWVKDIMSQSVVGTNETVFSQMESLKGDVEFQQATKTYAPLDGKLPGGSSADTMSREEQAKLAAERMAQGLGQEDE